MIRAVMAHIGAEALRTVLQDRADRADAQRVTPPDMTHERRSPVWVRSLWGDFPIWRAYYTRQGGGDGSAPADGLLGLWNSCTPATARILSKLTALMPFEPAADLLRETTSATLSGRHFHRLTAEAADAARHWTAGRKSSGESPDTVYISYDGIGTPMRKECLAGRRGRGPDGKARTREMRLGCVFTQTSVDDDGQPVRDPASTTYLAGLLPADRFGRAIKAEAVRRGARKARLVVVLSDGANWCGKTAAMNFPKAMHILDFYHAAEHLRELCRALFGEGREATVRFRLWRRALRRGKAEAIFTQARDVLPQAKDPDDARRNLAYLERNRPHMHYDLYRSQGLFIGSGVIEAGCKTVVAQRAKLSGMLWGEKGVQDVLTLRCLLLGGELDRFWNHVFGTERAAA